MIKHETAIFAENRKASVLTVPREADQHRRQADSERQTPRELDIRAEKENERRNQQLAARHPEQARRQRQ